MIGLLKPSLTGFCIDFDKRVSNYFDKKISEQNRPELREVFRHLKDYILNGGKRLRPYTLYKINEEFKKLNGINSILLAFEFLHNSTLIDDDIIDEHDTRRGKPTI